MHFLVIDFEAGNASKLSACSLGMALVRENSIVWKTEFLIQPIDKNFHYFNVKIHGIHAELAEKGFSFEEMWPWIQPFFENHPIVAHNAVYDIGVLLALLEHYRIPVPHFQYYCSVQMAKMAWPHAKQHKLNYLASSLNILLMHHHALDDAVACAKIVLSMAKSFQAPEVSALASELGLAPGYVDAAGHHPLPRMPHSHPQKSRVKSVLWLCRQKYRALLRRLSSKGRF